jgi:ABC-type dipeptide/oligopeptide/nickel transport system ATPase component
MKRTVRAAESKAMLSEVQLGDVDRIYNAYPHQLSGGELHRVAIAKALICRPELVICDEPTSSLDVTIQAEILSLLRELKAKLGMAMIFITHNPALLAGFADRVLVMCDGRIVEEGRVARVFRWPVHAYTNELLQLATAEDDRLTFHHEN